jgi:small subunit ribosomal protein S6
VFHHEYETIVIARPELDDAAVTTIVEKLEAVVSSQGGRVLDRDDWGKRKLAYPIAKQQKGHYVRLHIAAPPSCIAELERRIRIEDQLIRFMTVQLGEAVDVEARAEAAAQARTIREEEARRRAEAEAAAAAAAAEYEAEQRALGLDDDEDDDDDDDNDND